MKKKRFWTEKKRKSVVWMCKMRKGSENKKKERKKNETIETAVIRFGNGSNDRGDVGDGISRMATAVHVLVGVGVFFWGRMCLCVVVCVWHGYD